MAARGRPQRARVAGALPDHRQRLARDAASSRPSAPRSSASRVDEQLHFVGGCSATCSRRARSAASSSTSTQSWWEFSGAARRSPGYQKFLADGLTRSLVAARAEEMSARTGGYILLQLLQDMAKPAGRWTGCSRARRTTSGSTPGWRAAPPRRRLPARRSRGRDPSSGERVTGVRASATRPAGRGRPSTRRPTTTSRPCRSRCCASHRDGRAQAGEPGARRPRPAVVRWMNGIMYYLASDVAARARAHDLHRLAVGADVDLAAPVLARTSTSRDTGDGASAASCRSTSPTGTRPGDLQRQAAQRLHAGRGRAKRSGRS